MKTYEEMTESILQKTEKRRAKLARRKRLLSLFAAVAAVVIVMTAIPVGALIIANRAQTPPEAGSETKTETETYAYTEKTEDKPVLPENAEYFRNMTAIGKLPESAHGMPIVTGYAILYIENAFDAAKKTDGGYLHYMYVQCTADFTAEYDNYQIDLILTDGNEELSHLTFNNEESAFDPLVAYNLDLFIPDGLEYCEVYLYFNLLDHETAAIENYAAAPYGKSCAAFAKKYGYIMTSYGIDKLEADRETLMTYVESNLHDYVFKLINRLYWYDDIGLNIIKQIQGQSAYEDALRFKAFIEEELTSYKKDHKEEYDAIIQEWVDYKMKRNSQITDPGYYHDPLEDIQKHSEGEYITEAVTGQYYSKPYRIDI